MWTLHLILFRHLILIKKQIKCKYMHPAREHYWVIWRTEQLCKLTKERCDKKNRGKKAKEFQEWPKDRSSRTLNSLGTISFGVSTPTRASIAQKMRMDKIMAKSLISFLAWEKKEENRDYLALGPHICLCLNWTKNSVFANSNSFINKLKEVSHDT